MKQSIYKHKRVLLRSVFFHSGLHNKMVEVLRNKLVSACSLRHALRWAMETSDDELIELLSCHRSAPCLNLFFHVTRSNVIFGNYSLNISKSLHILIYLRLHLAPMLGNTSLSSVWDPMQERTVCQTHWHRHVQICQWKLVSEMRYTTIPEKPYWAGMTHTYNTYWAGMTHTYNTLILKIYLGPKMCFARSRPTLA